MTVVERENWVLWYDGNLSTFQMWKIRKRFTMDYWLNNWWKMPSKERRSIEDDSRTGRC